MNADDDANRGVAIETLLGAHSNIGWRGGGTKKGDFNYFHWVFLYPF